MLRVVEIEQTCNACPSQWEGKLEDGRYFYARFRWGRLSVSVSPNSRDSAVMGEVICQRNVGDGMDGYMSQAEMLRHADMEEVRTDDARDQL